MSDVHQRLLKLWEERRGKPKLFQGEGDQKARERATREFITRQGAAVHFIPRASQTLPEEGKREGHGVDPLDLDILDPEFFDDSVRYDLRVDIEHTPSRQELTKYGIEEERDVVFHVPFTALQELGLVEPKRRFRGIAIGDLFEWDGTLYITRESHRTDYHGLTDTNFYTSAFCVRYHFNATPEDPEGPPCSTWNPVDPPPLAAEGG